MLAGYGNDNNNDNDGKDEDVDSIDIPTTWKINLILSFLCGGWGPRADDPGKPRNYLRT